MSPPGPDGWLMPSVAPRVSPRTQAMSAQDVLTVRASV
jgi:hypothetical protein